MSDLVTARCLISRMIADDRYAAGETYTMDAARAARYAALGYFEVLGPAPVAPVAKMSAAPENKVLGRREHKGIPNREGVPAELDGSPVDEPARGLSHAAIRAGGDRP